MSKTTVFIIVVIALFWGLPILSGKATAVPESLEPIAIARWISSLIQFWIELVKELIRQLRL